MSHTYPSPEPAEQSEKRLFYLDVEKIGLAEDAKHAAGKALMSAQNADNVHRRPFRGFLTRTERGFPSAVKEKGAAASSSKEERISLLIIFCVTLYIRCIYRITQMNEQSTLNIRLPADLKKAFEAVCEQKDITASQAIRAFIRDYVTKNAQGSLLK